MKRARSGAQGYTIVETLIFLAVSGAIAVAAIVLVGGQQRRTSFSQSVREMELTLQDLMNDVATGTFPSPGEVSCDNTGPGGAPRVEINTGEQGTNEDCILVGRVVHFMPSGEYRIFSVAGLKGNVRSVSQSLSSSRPTLIPATASLGRIPFGLTVKSMRVDAPICPSGNLRSMGFFTNFAGYVGSVPSNRVLESSSRNADAFALCVTESATEATLQSEISGAAAADDDRKNPTGSGIRICLHDGGTQEGLITIGGAGGQFTTSSAIGAGVC